MKINQEGSARHKVRCKLPLCKLFAGWERWLSFFLCYCGVLALKPSSQVVVVPVPWPSSQASTSAAELLFALQHFIIGAFPRKPHWIHAVQPHIQVNYFTWIILQLIPSFLLQEGLSAMISLKYLGSTWLCWLIFHSSWGVTTLQFWLSSSIVWSNKWSVHHS